MRFLFKLSFWAVVVILIMPTDRDHQAKIYRSAEHAVSEAQSFCDKRPALCERGAVMWDEFKLKAAFVSGLASDLAMELIFSTPQDRANRKDADRLTELSGYTGVPTPAPAYRGQGTLTPNDRAAAAWAYPAKP